MPGDSVNSRLDECLLGIDQTLEMFGLDNSTLSEK